MKKFWILMILAAMVMAVTPSLHATVACLPPEGGLETAGPFTISSVRLRLAGNLKIDLDDGEDLTYRTAGSLQRDVQQMTLHAMANNVSVSIEWDDAFLTPTGCSRSIRAISVHELLP